MTELRSLAEINPAPEPRPQKTLSTVTLIAVADIDASTATVVPRQAPREAIGSAYRTARAGDVLFARISPSMENGKLAIVPELGSEFAYVSGELVVLRPREGVDPRLIWAFLRQTQVRQDLRRLMTGSAGRQRLKTDAIRQIDVPVPSASTWRRAAAALDHLDRAAAIQATIAEALRSLPAAAAHKASLEAPREPLGSFEVEFRYGTNERAEKVGSVPVLRVPNIVEGEIDLDDLRFLPEQPEHLGDLLEHGDLLVSRTSRDSAQLARAAVYESEPARTAYASYLVRIRSHDLEPDFLWAWMQTDEAHTELLDRAARKGRDLLGIDITVLRQLPVPRIASVREARVALLARQARGLSRLAREQLAALELVVAAHLASVFGEPTTESIPAEQSRPQRAPAEDFLPAVYAAASRQQRELWREVCRRKEGFGLDDLELSDLKPLETERASLQHSLAILEQLGVLVRESTDHAYRWRPPDSEMELLS
jgi:type I restriction enzyme S subunit